MKLAGNSFFGDELAVIGAKHIVEVRTIKSLILLYGRQRLSATCLNTQSPCGNSRMELYMGTAQPKLIRNDWRASNKKSLALMHNAKMTPSFLVTINPHSLPNLLEISYIWIWITFRVG
jgi:hypothetical protein